jgi:beta-lactamase class A
MNWLMACGLVALAGWGGIETDVSDNQWLFTPPEFKRGLTVAQAMAEDPFTLPPLPEKTISEALKARLLSRIAQYGSDLNAKVYFLDLQTGETVNIGADEPIAAASVIKLPVLMAYFRAVDAGRYRPETALAYQPHHVAEGSGDLQFRDPTIALPSLEVATRMIQSSDNSATNMLIDYLGGMPLLNHQFARMGLQETRLNNWLPDLSGTNHISMRDMARLLVTLSETDYLSPASRQTALRILEGTHNRRLIPAGLPPGTQVAHKTGDIGTSLGNAALVTLNNGTRRYVLSVQVARPHNDYRAKALIIDLSRDVYDYLQQRVATVDVDPGFQAR